MVELGPMVPVDVCDRCGRPADVERFDISTFDHPKRSLLSLTCRVPGCVNDYGSSACEPPDVPGELTREDRKWLRKHRRLAVELAEVERRLLREVA